MPRRMKLLQWSMLAVCLVMLLHGRESFVAASDGEKRLIQHLLKGYNPLIRPSENDTPITVQISLQLIQIINVDERNQVMKTNVWLRVQWKDPQLLWNPENFDNITTLRMDPSVLWNPDIVLFNNADGKYEVSYNCRMILSQDGTIFQLPPSIYKSSCSIDVEFFPFDEQTCPLKFGSWTYSADQVKLAFMLESYKSIELSDYVTSGAWDVIKVPGSVVNVTSPVGMPNKTRIDYQIVIRRKTLFYTVNLIIPCVLISFLSVCVFYLPADAGEKMTLSISILLSLVVFLLLLQKILPPTSTSVPLIAVYLLFTFILNILSIFVTVVIINISFRTPRTHKITPWIKVVFLKFLPKLLLMKVPPDSDDEDDGDDDDDEVSVSHEMGIHTLRDHSKCCTATDAHQAFYKERGYFSAAFSGRSPSTDTTQQDGKKRAAAAKHHPSCNLHAQLKNGRSRGSGANKRLPSAKEPSAGAPRMPREIFRTVQAIRFIAQHMKKDDEFESMQKSWKYIGMVIDRLLLIIFLTITTGGTIGIFINSPHVFTSTDQERVIKDYKELKQTAENHPMAT